MPKKNIKLMQRKWEKCDKDLGTTTTQNTEYKVGWGVLKYSVNLKYNI